MRFLMSEVPLHSSQLRAVPIESCTKSAQLGTALSKEKLKKKSKGQTALVGVHERLMDK